MKYKFNAPFNYSLAYNILNVIFPILTIPIVLRVFSNQQYGEYVFVNVVYQIFNVLFVLSVQPFFIRDFIRKIESGISKTVCLSQNLQLQLYLSLSCVFFYIVTMLFLIHINATSMALSGIFLLPIIFSFINFEWYFYATQRYKEIFYRSLFVKLITLIAIVLCINDEKKFIVYASIMSGSYLLTNLIGFLYVSTHIRPSVIFENKIDFFDFLFKAKSFITNSSIGVCYQYIDQLLVGLFLSKGELAALSILKQLLNASIMLPTTVCRLWMPISIAKRNNIDGLSYIKNNVKLYVILITSIFLGLMLVGVPALNFIATDKYAFSIIDVIFCGLCMLVTASAVFIDTQISIPNNLEKITTFSNSIVLICFSISIVPLTLAVGYLGPIASLTFSELLGVLSMGYMHIFKYKTHTHRYK
ncbi:oligosaccharide flippase family protein [Aeromonas caviae]|uniref:oligosaccharide flippase family protein n=1 Tax=Aeromonas TaxID=642 RepID=UPI0022DF89FE|nr:MULTISPECIES: oligosaccharide flippase family protein [Aeromonas]MEA9442490.1 oligosaccharide flippase family protein [Aeromonas caviae]